MNMIRVTYISQESSPMSADALLALVTQCHKNNTGKGLTGMLLHGNNTFLQVLEGEHSIVEALLAIIGSDTRHVNMKVLHRESISSRQYSDWSMGFEQVTERTLRQTPGLRNFGLRNFTAEYLSENSNVVEALLERHRAPHWDPLIRELDARDKLITELRRELSQARNDSEMTALVLETVITQAKDGKLDDAHLEICRTALRGLR